LILTALNAVVRCGPTQLTNNFPPKWTRHFQRRKVNDDGLDKAGTFGGLLGRKAYVFGLHARQRNARRRLSARAQNGVLERLAQNAIEFGRHLLLADASQFEFAYLSSLLTCRHDRPRQLQHPVHAKSFLLPQIASRSQPQIEFDKTARLVVLLAQKTASASCWAMLSHQRHGNSTMASPKSGTLAGNRRAAVR
jgi:hypothetical protein